jgi:D-alanine-D-alanine ligase-like ATP-grasp enzyme
MLEKLFRAGSLATIVPTLGVRRGLEYRRLVRSQPHDREQAVYEYIWRDAADALGVEMVNEGDGTFSFDDGRARVRSLNTPLDGSDTIDYSLNKPAVATKLAALGIPVPAHHEFRARELHSAIRFLAEHDGPCVVKPADGFGGHGARLIIECQVPGDLYRLLFLDGLLLDVVRRLPAHVTGDGASSVIELIAGENLRRVRAGGFAGLTLIRPDLDCILALRAVGLRPKHIPSEGMRFAVRTSNGDGGDSDTETIDVRACDAIVGEAAAACAAVGARLAGVDVATSDLSRDLRTSGGAVIEVNIPPGLQFHYLVADRSRAVHVAIPILRRLLEGPNRARVVDKTP